MATGANAAGTRTPAQWFCLVVGVVLVAAGILGFITDSSFDTGTPLNGDKLLGLEVNGWHNLVHIASGAFLLAMSPKRASAKTGALAFAAIYVVVTIIGLADGNDVFGLFPVNPADNVLHIAISALGIVSGVISKGTDDVTGDAGVVGTGGRTQAGARA